MAEIPALQSLGLEMPSLTYILGSLLFSSLGYIAFRYGRKHEQDRRKWLGLTLMFYPYFVSNTWLMYILGTALCTWIYVDGR